MNLSPTVKTLIASQRLLLDAIEAMSDHGPTEAPRDDLSAMWEEVNRRGEPQPESAAPASVESYWPTGEAEQDPAQPVEPQKLSMEEGQRAAHYEGQLQDAYRRAQERGSFEVVTSAESVVISTDTGVDLASEPVEADEPVAVPEPEPTKEAGTVISQVVAAYKALKARGVTPDSKSIGKEIGRSPANVSAHLCFARQRGLIPPAEKPAPVAPSAVAAQELEAPKPLPPRGGATKGIEVSADFTAISGPQGSFAIPEKFGRMLAVMASGYLFAEDRLQKAAGAHARTWPADQLRYHRAALLEIGIIVDHQKGVGWRIKIAETGRLS